jgi:hypothetical protein
MKRFLAILMLGMLAAGCGYRTPGQGDSWVGGNGRTLFVDLIANRTAEPYLDNYVTSSLVRQLSRSRHVELTEDRDRADLLLTGFVTQFDRSATAFDEDDRIADYRVTVDLVARLSDRLSGEVLWQDELRRSENYYASVNKNLQLEQQSLAARQIAERLAEDLHARLLDAF